MASGCVPVVISKGGQNEIVEDNVSGLLWSELDVLNKLTVKLIKDNSLSQKMAFNAVQRSKLFNKQHFRDKINRIVYGL